MKTSCACGKDFAHAEAHLAQMAERYEADSVECTFTCRDCGRTVFLELSDGDFTVQNISFLGTAA